MMNIAKAQESYQWLAKTYWLQSKLALLVLDFDKAQLLLTQAQTLAEGKKLQALANQISNEYSSLLTQMNRWKKLKDQSPSFAEIIDFTQFENLVNRLVQKKLFKKDEEVIDYSRKARSLLQELS